MVTVPRMTLVVGTLALTACGGPEPIGNESIATPEIFAPGVVSTDLREYGITFTPDGQEAYFTRRGRRSPPQIFTTRLVEGAWSKPELAPFSGERDEAPFISADGTRMLFSSQRFLPVSGDVSNNIWEMERTEEGWSEPVPLAGEVNEVERELEEFTTGREMGPVMTPGGSLLYWTATDPEWGDDIYVADPDEDGGFVDPRPLRINSYGSESNPALSRDGRYLVFQGYRDAAGIGEQDLYVAERTDFGWGDPRLLPTPINSVRSDGYPSFSPDGRFFFFASDRHTRGGYYSVYYVSVAALGLPAEPR